MVGGEKQVPGERIQKSGQTDEVSAARLLRSDSRHLPTAFQPMEKVFAAMAALDKVSTPTGKGKTRNSKNWLTDAGMSMKTKDQLSTGGARMECYRKQR